jgi:hypothetical protein
MKRLVVIMLCALVALFLDAPDAAAQSRRQRVRGASAARWQRDKAGDSVLYITILPVRVGGGVNLKEHERMVRAVKKVYPLAKDAAHRLELLDEELRELERKRDQKAYMKAVEDAL